MTIRWPGQARGPVESRSTGAASCQNATAYRLTAADYFLLGLRHYVECTKWMCSTGRRPNAEIVSEGEVKENRGIYFTVCACC